MTRNSSSAVLALVLAAAWGPAPAVHAATSEVRQRLSLDGVWQFQADPENAGQNEQWYANPQKIAGKITVPGAWQAQGVGEPVGVLRHHYEGAAWYARTVSAPGEWKGSKVYLTIGGAFTYTAAYVNGLPAGTHEGFATPFRFDITPLIRPGQPNLVVLRVANARDPLRGTRRDLTKRDTSEPAGASNFAAPWGGLYRGVALEARSPVAIDHVAVVTGIDKRVARITVTIRNDSTQMVSANIEAAIAPGGQPECARKVEKVAASAGASTRVVLEMPVANARLWSPETPHLYSLTLTLSEGPRRLDQQTESFGFREIRVEGARLLLNGAPVYLRGYGDDSAEVLTGAPPADKATYRRRFEIARRLGFNSVRFHSTTPTEECFQAADEAGLLVAAELPVIYQEYLLPHKDLLRQELVRIFETYRNHPSWFLFTLGNEFSLSRIPDERGKQAFLGTVGELVALAKRLYPEILVSSNSGYLVAPMDIAIPYRGFAPGLPNVKHEYGSYACTLPDPSLIPRFTGVFEPKWLAAQKQWIEQAGLAAVYPELLKNSWRLHASVVKAFIEKLRSIPEFTGYFYWLINDYPGGTPEGSEWNWGWLNPFFEPKLISPEQGREMNAGVLPLIGTPADSRTFWLEDGKTVDVLVSKFGGTPIGNAIVNWELNGPGRRVAAGSLSLPRAPLGEITKAGHIRIAPLALHAASGFELVIRLVTPSGEHVNRWKLWGFPRSGLMKHAAVPVISLVKSASLRRFFPFVQDAAGSIPAGAVLLASEFQPAVLEHLHGGGRVLILGEPGRFGSRLSYWPGSGGALGASVRMRHPSLDGFPHEGYPDLQFFNLIEGGVQAALGAELPPLIGGVRMTRVAHESRLSRLSLLWEAKAGKGGLLFTGLNLRANLDEAFPEAVFMLDRLLRYVTSENFQPHAEIPDEQIGDVRVPYTEMIH